MRHKGNAFSREIDYLDLIAKGCRPEPPWPFNLFVRWRADRQRRRLIVQAYDYGYLQPRMIKGEDDE